VNLIPEPKIALQNVNFLFGNLRLKGNPWFSEKLSDDRDLAWSMAKKSKNSSDCQHVRHLRNKCVSQIYVKQNLIFIFFKLNM